MKNIVTEKEVISALIRNEYKRIRELLTISPLYQGLGSSEKDQLELIRRYYNQIENMKKVRV